MNTELIVALISGGIALVSAGFAMWGQFTSARLAADLQNLQLAEAGRSNGRRPFPATIP